MKMKKNKSGKMQYYDSKGRYTSMPVLLMHKNELSKKEKKRKKRDNFNNALRQKAEIANRRNPYLLEVFEEINQNFPNKILDVECDMNNKYTQVPRNLDIVTHKFIIEVKSGKSKGKDRQLYAQKIYGEKVGKTSIVYAPNIDSNSEKRYTRKGIIIFRKLNDMIKYMKEKIK